MQPAHLLLFLMVNRERPAGSTLASESASARGERGAVVDVGGGASVVSAVAVFVFAAPPRRAPAHNAHARMSSPWSRSCSASDVPSATVEVVVVPSFCDACMYSVWSSHALLVPVDGAAEGPAEGGAEEEEEVRKAL